MIRNGAILVFDYISRFNFCLYSHSRLNSFSSNNAHSSSYHISHPIRSFFRQGIPSSYFFVNHRVLFRPSLTPFPLYDRCGRLIWLFEALRMARPCSIFALSPWPLLLVCISRLPGYICIGKGSQHQTRLPLSEKKAVTDVSSDPSHLVLFKVHRCA